MIARAMLWSLLSILAVIAMGLGLIALAAGWCQRRERRQRPGRHYYYFDQ
jgi:hypothetical protein